MRAIHIVIILILGVSIAVAVSVMQRKQTAQAAPAPLAGPPADARFLRPGLLPLNVIQSEGIYNDYWIPEPGWQVGVEAVTEERGGKALRIPITQSTPLYGQLWLVVLVPEHTNVRKNDFCMITGRIHAIEKYSDGGPVEARRLIVRDGKVVKNITRPN